MKSNSVSTVGGNGNGQYPQATRAGPAACGSSAVNLGFVPGQRSIGPWLQVADMPAAAAPAAVAELAGQVQKGGGMSRRALAVGPPGRAFFPDRPSDYQSASAPRIAWLIENDPVSRAPAITQESGRAAVV